MTARMTITSMAATDTGFLTMRSRRNATRAIPAVVTARMSRERRAPVSDRNRKCATVHIPKISRASALPTEAIAFRANPSASTRLSAAATRSPTDAR
jgi:hypothetical protein